MADSKNNIDEELLREKLLGYRVSFDPACLTALENEMAQVKTHAHIELPDSKKVIRFSIIALGILLFAGISYWVIQAVQKNNLEKEEPKTEAVSQPTIEEPKSDETPVTPTVALVDTINALENNSDTISVSSVPEKQVENIVTEKKREEKRVKKLVIAQVDSVAKVDTVGRKTRVDSASTDKSDNQPSKKKKKRRKNNLDATQDIRNAAPSSSDDDVIVPDN